MIIQLNVDNRIDGQRDLSTHLTTDLEHSLARFADHITRIEVHFQDANANRGGRDDKKCLIEARLAGESPIAVSDTSDTLNGAFFGARDKLLRVLEKHVSKHRPPKGIDPYEGVAVL